MSNASTLDFPPARTASRGFAYGMLILMLVMTLIFPPGIISNHADLIGTVAIAFVVWVAGIAIGWPATLGSWLTLCVAGGLGVRPHTGLPGGVLFSFPYDTWVVALVWVGYCIVLSLIHHKNERDVNGYRLGIFVIPLVLLFCAGFHSIVMVAGCALVSAAGFAMLITLGAEPHRFWYLLAVSEPMGTGVLQGQQPDRIRSPAPDYARYTFADVIGMEELKKRLLRAAVAIVPDRSRRPAHESVVDRRLREREEAKKPKARARNGILLHGAPGNGKSLFAESLAGELKLPFFRLSYGDMASRWVNQSTEQLVEVFRKARASAPCVLFFDEADALLVNRAGVTQVENEAGKLVTTFLKEVDSLKGARVVLVAATNHLDRLDPAAIREGRFDFKIEIPPPDFDARRAILTRTLAKAGAPAPSITAIDSAAKRWEGFSAARLTAIAEEAASLASERHVAGIDLALLTEALRRTQASRGSHLAENGPGLKDIFLAPDLRADLENLVRRMREPEAAEKIGATVPRGALFSGPPGTGKTLTAQALARDSGWAFLSTSGQELGRDLKAIDTLMEKAADLRPCLVFIDEADDILASREGFAAQMGLLNHLLAAMDGAGGRTPDLLFVAATNRPEAMDAAALRGGRFSEKFAFKLPTAEFLSVYLDQWLARLKIPLETGLTKAMLLDLLGDLAFADVDAILQAATNRSVGRNPPIINADDLRAARQRVCT